MTVPALSEWRTACSVERRGAFLTTGNARKKGEKRAMRKNQTVTFTDLPGGTYTMNWCLVYGKDPRGNIAGNKVSNTASFTYTNTVLTDRPLLDVVLNPKVDSYVIPQGTQKKLQFHLETSCNQSETDKAVSITIEKQGTLCNFIPVDENSAGFVVMERLTYPSGNYIYKRGCCYIHISCCTRNLQNLFLHGSWPQQKTTYTLHLL